MSETVHKIFRDIVARLRGVEQELVGNGFNFWPRGFPFPHVQPDPSLHLKRDGLSERPLLHLLREAIQPGPSGFASVEILRLPLVVVEGLVQEPEAIDSLHIQADLLRAERRRVVRAPEERTASLRILVHIQLESSPFSCMHHFIAEDFEKLLGCKIIGDQIRRRDGREPSFRVVLP